MFRWDISLVSFGLLLSGCAGATRSTALSGGQPFPEVGLKTPEGQDVSVQDVRGKVALVDFWATWCEPCKESLPVYDGFVKEMGEKGFTVIAISEDEDATAVKPFLESHAPNVVGWHDPGAKLADHLQLPAMPTAFLLDRNGNVIHVHAGFLKSDAPKLRQQIEAALNTH